MTKTQLSSDATIADVVSTLSKPEDYLCKVLGQMHACQKAHGNAVVRIGVMGGGKYPAYRVEYELQGTDVQSGKVVTAPNGKLFGAWRALGHSAFSNDEVQEITWSTAFLNKIGVEKLLGDFRKIKKQKQ